MPGRLAQVVNLACIGVDQVGLHVTEGCITSGLHREQLLSSVAHIQVTPEYHLGLKTIDLEPQPQRF